MAALTAAAVIRQLVCVPSSLLPLSYLELSVPQSLSVYACPLPLVNFCSFVQCALKCRAAKRHSAEAEMEGEVGKMDERAVLPQFCRCKRSFNTAISQLDNASLARNQQVEKGQEEKEGGKEENKE